MKRSSQSSSDPLVGIRGLSQANWGAQTVRPSPLAGPADGSARGGRVLVARRGYVNWILACVR